MTSYTILNETKACGFQLMVRYTPLEQVFGLPPHNPSPQKIKNENLASSKHTLSSVTLYRYNKYYTNHL